jgi:hypothetical protein
LPVGSRRAWSPQLSPTSGEKGLSRTPAAFQASAGDYVAEDNVKISIEFQKSALTKNANAALLCSVVSLGHGELLGLVLVPGVVLQFGPMHLVLGPVLVV